MSTLDDYPDRRGTPTWLKVLLIAGLVIAAILFLRSMNLGSSLGGIGAGCSTHREFTVPTDTFMGVEVAMAAERCEGSGGGLIDTTEKSYVLVTVEVDGKASDEVKIRELAADIRVDRRAKKGEKRWLKKVPPTSIPEDVAPVFGTEGEVKYTTQQRWDVPKTQAKVIISLNMQNAEGKTAKVSHTFDLP